MLNGPSDQWHTLPIDAVERELDTAESGLSDQEAAERLTRYGPNEVAAERATPWWLMLLRQFMDPLIYILLIAALVTLALRDHVDTGVILAVVVLNAVIGFIQERRAQRAIESLSQMSTPRAEVLRAGRTREVPGRELVPGDVVILTSGVRVPADLRLTRAADLHADESALTGESATVGKGTDPLDSETLVPGDRVNMAFAGTLIARGRGRGIVVHTGAATELGRIATAVREIGITATPLQEAVAHFGRLVAYAIAALTLVVVILGILRAMEPQEIFLAAVALSVSAVPEGLPVVLTVTLAIGVSRMARRNAIIRSLPAVETLGSTTVIGSDKTGTLTKNEMTVRSIWSAAADFEVSGAGYARDGAVERDGEPADLARHDALRQTLTAGVLANEADADDVANGSPHGDPTEVALHVAAAKAGLDPEQMRTQYGQLDIVPFESERRYMATLNDGPDGRHVYMKGAPEAVLDRCDRQLGQGGVEALQAGQVRRAAAAMAERGLRVLAFACVPTDAGRLSDDLLADGLVLAGLQGMEDPVRPEAVDAIRATHEAGIRVLMLTGDHVDTARAIGRQLGLDPDGAGALEGQVIASLSDDELDRELGRVNIHARVAPEHKLRIVQRLKAAGAVVAVTGDGVNDAPALREAHIGIAMGRSGTDVAKEASDMVLADDNFASITAAIDEGRVVFSNIRKVTFFLLSTAVGEILTILVALALGWPLPFIAAQILWINLVTNGVQDVALAFEPGEPGLLRRPPRPVHEGIVTRRIAERLGGVGLVLGLGTLGIFWWTLRQTQDLDLARTAAMTQMVVFQFYHVFNCRSLDRSVFAVPFFSNRFLFWSILAAAVAHLAVLYVGPLQTIFRTVPLPVELWALILLIGTTVIVGGELDKWRNRNRHQPLG